MATLTGVNPIYNNNDFDEKLKSLKNNQKSLDNMVLDGKFDQEQTYKLSLENHQINRELQTSKLFNKEGKDLTYHSDEFKKKGVDSKGNKIKPEDEEAAKQFLENHPFNAENTKGDFMMQEYNKKKTVVEDSAETKTNKIIA